MPSSSTEVGALLFCLLATLFVGGVAVSKEVEEKTPAEAPKPLYKSWSGSRDPNYFPEETATDTAALCKQYRNKYITFAGSVYQVSDKCELRTLEIKEAAALSRQRKLVLTVSASVISAFRKGAAASPAKIDLCQYNGMYFVSTSKHFYVDKCLLRPFKNYNDFIRHLGSLSKSKGKVLPLPAGDLPIGRVMPSQHKTLDHHQAPLQQLPKEKVCQQLEGYTYVSYINSVFKVHRSGGSCDLEQVADIKKIIKSGNKLKELTPSQVFSLFGPPESSPANGD